MLIIVESDSSKINKNGQVYNKNWRCVVENFGFRRFVSEKSGHLFKMGFVKVPEWAKTNALNLTEEELVDLLKIVQDNNLGETQD